MTFSHFPQDQGKCPKKRRNNNNYKRLSKIRKATKEPAPGRSEIPHWGDDAVIGGWTFSHFLRNNGKTPKETMTDKTSDTRNDKDGTAVRPGQGRNTPLG